MKYFKPELWSGYNSDNNDEVKKAEEQWSKNDKEYTQVFEKIKERLPKGFLKIYLKEQGFHDYHLKNVEVIHGSEGYKNPISVSLEIQAGENIWNIIYKGVTKIRVDYEDENIKSHRARRLQRGFDDYGYDEFIEVDENTISHEILFASDATILVHFKKISIKRIKYRGNKSIL